VPVSENTGLPSAILGLKCSVQYNLWKKFSETEKTAFTNRILSFQKTDITDNIEYGFFIDSVIENNIGSETFLSNLFKQYWRQKRWLLRFALLRQCWKTLDKCGAGEKVVFPSALSNNQFLPRWIKGLNSLNDAWSMYSHISGIIAIAAMAEKYSRKISIDKEDIIKNINIENAINCLQSLHPKIGVSGAMKLTTLADEINMPLPYPEKLIDIALKLTKAEHVCYFLNPLLVLDRCSIYTDYRKNDINNFYEKRIKILDNFLMPDKGYATMVSGSVKNFGQIVATKNEKCADIHAAHILGWAILLIANKFNIELDMQQPPT
jgi:hypothetical protein